MSPTYLESWEAANQRYMVAAVQGIRRRLEAYQRQLIERVTTGESPFVENDPAEREARVAARSAMSAPPALEQLCESFHLSSFERDVLVLCAGMELDAAIRPLCATIQGDPTIAYPTFSLALASLTDPHWSAATPTGPLRRWRLVDVGTGPTLTMSPLRIDERVLHFLAGTNSLDVKLAGLVEPAGLPTTLVESQEELCRQCAMLWSNPIGPRGLPIIQLCGPDSNVKQGIASTTSSELGLNLCRMQDSVLPTTPAEIDGLAHLWEREAVFSGSALYLDCDEVETSDIQRGRAVTYLAEHIQGPLFVAVRERRTFYHRRAVALDVPKPKIHEQRLLWQRALGSYGKQLNGQIDALTAQFDMSAAGIEIASGQLLGLAEDSSPSGSTGERLWSICRLQARPRLDDLAQHIEPMAAWKDLILPEAQCQTLRDITTHVRQRARVYESWGFAARSQRGLGISALFSGDSGTGKTMAAEVLANELRLDLFRIDLSQVVSKYIGETEKNLRRVFDAAEEGGVILLFDEADALFGKRSEVKDSHDRYANIEISYLLQRMEAYRGLAILTTNLKSALDTAFLRRIRFIVQFPFPDPVQRAEIWRRIFPAQTPTEGLEIEKLARLSVTGGHIRNIALGAAFFAAEEGKPVHMAHLRRATRAEYAKIDKPLTESELSGWV